MRKRWWKWMVAVDLVIAAFAVTWAIRDDSTTTAAIDSVIAGVWIALAVLDYRGGRKHEL